MTLNRVYLVPHGDEIIDLPNKNSEQLNRHIRKTVSSDSSETIVVLSPHGISLSGSFGVLNTQHVRADLKLKTKRIRAGYTTDRALSEEIIDKVPGTQGISYATYSGPKSVLPLDFGSVIPLYFFEQRSIVAIGQPRIWDLELLQQFGKKLVDIVEASDRKVSIVISADQAHTHSANGPYGYSEDSAKYEALIEECVVNSDFSPLLRLRKDFITRAKPDSYWNMLVLKGIMEQTGLKTTLDYHYIEEYFGMLLAHLI